MSTQHAPEIDYSTNQLGLPPPEKIDRTDFDGAGRWARGEIWRRHIVGTERSPLGFVSKVLLGNIAIVLAIAMLIEAPSMVLVATTFAFVSWLIVRGSIGGAVSEDVRNARGLGLAVSSVALLAAAFIFTDVLRIALGAAGLAGLFALRFTAAGERWLPVIQPTRSPEAKLLTEASDARQSGGATRNPDAATRSRAAFRRGTRDRAYSDARSGGAARSRSTRPGRRGVVRELSGERRTVVDRDVGREHEMTWILPSAGNFASPNVLPRLMRVLARRSDPRRASEESAAPSARRRVG